MIVEKSSVVAPCEEACPASIDVPRYIRLIAHGDFDQALSVNREKIPFPSVCSYVCAAPCENACRMNLFGKAIAIRPLKRLAAEKAKIRPCVERGTPTNMKVAIVGSGPSGLTAAYFLAKKGHEINVFESLPVIGGMMRVGIPDYRLPKMILEREIETIKATGVNIMTNTQINSVDVLFEQGYNAVLLAVGAHKTMEFGIKNEKGLGVIDCLSMLRKINMGKKIQLGNKVGVIGGGNSAFEAARIALRSGSKNVFIIYRRTKSEMSAFKQEIDAGIEEGVEIIELTLPVRIIRRNGQLIGIECVRLNQQYSEADLILNPIQGSEHVISANTLIIAIGQTPDLATISDLPTEDINSWNRLMVDTETMATSKRGLFASGDVVNGTNSIIDAIADGRRAAIYIDKYLGGTGEIDSKLIVENEVVEYQVPDLAKNAVSIPTIYPKECIKSFTLVENTLTEEEGISEAKRCIRCDIPVYIDHLLCIGCGVCETVCSGDVIRMSSETNKAVVKYPQHCWTCYNCEICCPVDAIRVSPVKKQKPVILKANRHPLEEIDHAGDKS